MNSTMDRRFPVIPFDLNRFTPFFGNSESDLQYELLSGGACNSNYLVTRKGKEKFVCRMHTRGNPQTEQYIMELVKDIVPAPGYLWVGEGVSVMPFIHGSHFEPTQTLMAEAGRTIAKLATVSLERFGEIHADGTISTYQGWESYGSGLTRLLGTREAARYLDPATIDRLLEIVESNAALLKSFKNNPNLVHGDFRPDNILVSGDAIVAVLDWEFSHSGTSFKDMGNILRHFPLDWQNDLARGLREEGFILPEDWRYRAYLVDLSSHLEFLTSNKSHEFKLTCVGRIEQFIKIHKMQTQTSVNKNMKCLMPQ